MFRWAGKADDSNRLKTRHHWITLDFPVILKMVPLILFLATKSQSEKPGVFIQAEDMIKPDHTRASSLYPP